MKAKSIVGKLLLIGAIASMPCTGAFAAENNNKDAKDTIVYTTTVGDNDGDITDKISYENGEYSYYGFKGDEEEKAYSEVDLKNLPQVKFQKEDGKIVYKISNEIKVLDAKELDAYNLEVKEDGSLTYLDQEGHKCEYKLFYGTINGQESSYGVFNIIK